MTELTAKHERHRLVLKGADDHRLVAGAWGDPSAAPVIFLHGGGQTRHAWGGAAARVAAAGWYAVSVDLRGRGESDWTGRYHYRDFAADATCLADRGIAYGNCAAASAAWASAASSEPCTVRESDRKRSRIERRTITVCLRAVSAATVGRAAVFSICDSPGLAGEVAMPPVFVGASLGGTSAGLDNAGGDLCRAVVLVDIAPRANPQGVEPILHFMESAADGFGSLKAAADAVAGYIRQRKRTGDLRQRADRRWYWHWDPHFIETARGQSGKSSGQLEEAGRRLSIPTLLVRGSESDVLTEDGISAFGQAVPHARSADVAGAGQHGGGRS